MGMLQSIIKRKYILFQIQYAIILIITVFISTIGIFILIRYQSPTLVRILGSLLLISLIIACLKEYIFPKFSTKPDKNTNDIKQGQVILQKQHQFYMMNVSKIDIVDMILIKVWNIMI